MLNLKNKFVNMMSDLNEWKDNLHLDYIENNYFILLI
jgi:hypothetical protein